MCGICEVKKCLAVKLSQTYPKIRRKQTAVNWILVEIEMQTCIKTDFIHSCLVFMSNSMAKLIQ